ncbi:MAG TPA: hypothetical protein VHZ55_02730, partial [Bryobacteraceae bacterium]|nr:hypothetical protein [Bryobacteraceae bacterium]
LRIVERSSEDQWEEEVRSEWITPFDGTDAPLVRLVWLRGSGVHNLILVGHHCICDGQAGIGLLRDLLRAYENPESDLDCYDELCRLEEIVPPDIQNPKFHRHVRWKRRVLECVLWCKTRHRAKPPAIDGQSMYFHRCVLCRADAQTVVERSKVEDVTVLAPVALAFMQAFRDVRGTQTFQKVHTMVNARRFTQCIEPDSLFGLAPGVRMRAKDLPAPSDMGINTFWKRACAIKADLDKRVDQLSASFFQYLLSLEGLHHKYNEVVDFFERPPAVRHLTFSNLGRLALGAHYGDVRIEKVYSPLVMVSPTPANTVVLSSFAGEMEFAMISDEQSLPRAEAAAISLRAAEILRACVVN